MSGHEPTSPVATATFAGGRYEGVRILGSGGMGVVLLAEDTELDRRVAIKLMADNLALDEDARARFTQEARATARISHPNVVHVFDVGEQGGRPFLVMELVSGGSLADELRRRSEPFAADEAAAIARDALRGLAAAHAADLLHRDLKPANLLRAEGGAIKVTDFGAAQALEAGERLTRTGLVIGTLSYLPPERRAGEPATQATDLFSLGATLLELLTGENPTEADARPDGWSEPVHRLVDRLLEPDPRDRPASAREALEVFEGSTRAPRREGMTRVLEPAGSTERHADAASPRRGTGTAQTAGRDPRVPEQVRRAAPVVALALLALGVVAILATAADDGGGQPTAENAPAATAPAEATEVPAPNPADPDVPPEQLARDLADWLRDQAG